MQEKRNTQFTAKCNKMQNWQKKRNVHCNHRPQLAGFQSIIFFEDLFKRRYQDCQLIIITLSFSQTAQKIQLQLQRSFQKQTNILIYEKYMKYKKMNI